eukprot:CAMPEP_0201128942 /NCGR_PEP_ID=MMETSP0850-20130426/35290_1 /ASSEMBLY_ACC=CAM_ASM_000622 /TAXON_ID=183588 /ORGANISM="Pseudo-nitzschia fraudulenta, Strain WWA7" /LENGTH=408 /DNA_ID=CAMNT_0047398283 /DNA_START=47 /DNA_END=1273 /DNA_ORIENTATION=-
MDHSHHYPNTTIATATSNTETNCHGGLQDFFDITPAIHKAVAENNNGTKLVRQCRYDAAVRSFTSVLKILKPLAALVEEISNDDDETDYDEDEDEDFEGHESSSSECEFLTISFADNTASTDTVTSHSSLQQNGGSPRPQSPSYNNNNNNIESASVSQRRSSFTPPPTHSSSRTKQRRLSVPTPLSTSSLHSSNNYATTNRTSFRQQTNNGTAASPQQKQQQQRQQHDGHALFVFRDPSEISPGSVPARVSLRGEHSPALFSKFLMIVMYNLSLTLHLHALSIQADDNSSRRDTNKHKRAASSSKNKHSHKLLLRARKLYELSFEMHLDESCDVSLDFTLALINNLGLVYEKLGQKQRSKTCFKNMFSTMMYLMDTKESHTVKEWDGLMSNIMDVLYQQHKEVCAAAA